MMTQQDAVRSWAERWRSLKAWGRVLDVKLDVRERHQGNYSTGYCRPAMQEVCVTAGSDIAEALKVVLHEYAHAAVRGDEYHGPGWQACFARAVEEVTGLVVVDGAHNYRDMNAAALDAMRTWWRRSGNEFAWRLISKQKAR